MAKLLGLDIGSSSVMAGVLHGNKIVGKAPRVFFPTRCQGVAVEVQPEALLTAIKKALRPLLAQAAQVDALQVAVMSPAWVAMDAKGSPLTPLVTHQDRRSVAQAREMETRLGQSRHLQL